MIMTSYYYMLSHIVHPVSIAIKPPRWYRNVNYTKLAPSYQLLKEFKTGIIQADEFQYRYEKTVLQKLDPYETINEIKRYCNLPITSEETITLLSYERPGIVSHRNFVAEWLNTILPPDQQIRELTLADCRIDKYAVKHIDLYKDQIPELRGYK